MNNDFNLGRHEALIERLVEGQDLIIERVASIEHILAEKKGERRVALWGVGAVGGALGTAMSFMLKNLPALLKHS